MYNNRFRGFTLIELLVVIAIIGILSAVILASLNTARQKGSDASIQSNLGTIRTQAELYYGNQTPNQYSASTINGTSAATCTGGMLSDPTITQAITQAAAQNPSIACNVSPGVTGQYAISVGLVAQSGKFYCVDSTGAGKIESSQLTSSNFACP